MEGDILVNINNIFVRNMPHIKVVEVLKECEINSTANIIIERYIQNSPDKFHTQNEKDIDNTYATNETSNINSFNDCEINRPNTTNIDNRTKLSHISYDDYCQRDDSWTHVNSPKEFYTDPQSESSNGQSYVNSKPDYYSNNLSKSIQNMSFDNVESNNSNDKLR